MHNRSHKEKTTSKIRAIVRATVLLTVIAGGVFFVAVQPALAADNPLCQEEIETIVTMIEGFIQVTIALGLMGLLVVWQTDSLMEMVAFSDDQQATLKQHKRTTLKSALTLVLLGPVYSLVGSTMNLPIAECVNVIPF